MFIVHHNQARLLDGQLVGAAPLSQVGPARDVVLAAGAGHPRRGRPPRLQAARALPPAGPQERHGAGSPLLFDY